MASPNAKLITPPSEEEIIYPYRRVWRSIIVESGILFALTVVLYLFGSNIPATIRMPVNLIIAMLPLLLWLIFSLWQERFAQQPRSHLFAVSFLSALVANAIGFPLLNNILAVGTWVSGGDLIDSIVAHSVAIAIPHEIMKYLVIRYTVWRYAYRDAYDAVAYSVAGAIGYVTVFNLHYVFAADPATQVAAVRIFTDTAYQIMGSLIVAYGLAEMRFFKPSPLLLPGIITAAGVINAIVHVLRQNLANTRLTLSVSTPRTIIEIAIYGAALAFFIVAVRFLVANRVNSAIEDR